MASAAEQPEFAHRQYNEHSVEILQLPNEIFAAIFRTLPTSVVVRRIGAVCKDWRSIVKDDELWRLRRGLSELPSGFSSCFAYAQRQTMREQALDHLYGRAGLTQNWRKGLQLLSVLADAGDDYALALYGWALRDGVGIPQDSVHAAQLLQQSKHSMAYALCLLHGIGVPADDNAGIRVLNAECDTSDPHVQYLIGLCHRYRFGHVDATQALQCFERAGNHVSALYNLGDMVLNGFGVAQDNARAVVVFRHAAEQGYRAAKYYISCMYEDGNGVAEDLQQANHWYALAVEQRYPG